MDLSTFGRRIVAEFCGYGNTQMRGEAKAVFSGANSKGPRSSAGLIAERMGILDGINRRSRDFSGLDDCGRRN